MEIRRLESDKEIGLALDLAERVFDAVNASAYSAEGVDSFHGCLMMFRIFPVLEYWGCFAEGRLVGMLGNNGTQITLLFVDPLWQGRGVGRALIQDGFDQVKAFPGSVPFYVKCGFEATSEVENEDGIEYVMMERI